MAQFNPRHRSHNAQAAFDFAISGAARDREFLKNPSIGSMELLRRLGEVSGGKFIDPLLDQKLGHAAGMVMEGLATVSPREAFAWTGDHVSGELDSEDFAKAAAEMIDVDFDQVWRKMRLLDDAMVREWIAKKGAKVMDEFLASYWNRPDFRTDRAKEGVDLFHLFAAWDRDVSKHLMENLDQNQQASFRIQRWERLLALDLDPLMRTRLQAELDRLKQIRQSAQIARLRNLSSN